MQTRIQGTTMPVLDVQLDPNESVFSESGELSWMTASIQMTTHTQMGGGGGLFGIIKRVAGDRLAAQYNARYYAGKIRRDRSDDRIPRDHPLHRAQQAGPYRGVGPQSRCGRNDSR